jgi:signal transduction histidine kinase
LFFTPYIVVVSVLSNGTSISDASLPFSVVLLRYAGLVLANIASILACWLYIETVDRTLLRNKERKPIRLPWVLLFGASLGFLKGYTTGFFSWLVGSELDLGLAVSNRVFETTLLGTWTIPLLAIATTTFLRYKKEREVLLAESLGQRLSLGDSFQTSGGSSEELDRYLSRAKAEVSAMRYMAENATSNQIISRKLRELVEKGLRPISHRIWKENSQTARELKISELVILAVKKNPFPIRFIIGGLAVGILPVSLSSFPSGEALVRTLVMLTVISLILIVGKTFSRKSGESIGVRIVIANLMATSASLVAGDAFFDSTFATVNPTNWLALFIWQLHLSVFSSVVHEVLNTRAQMRQRLIESLGKNQLDSEVNAALGRIKNRDLAQYIHGNIQNKLLSFALKFDQENLATHDVSRLLDEVEDLFITVGGGYNKVDPADLDKELLQLVHRWSGFVLIDLKNHVLSSVISSGDIRSIVEVVSEAVSNAVRHGLAKSLKITLRTIEPNNSQIEIVVEDDGLGPRSGKSGLGTELFNAASGANWSLCARKTGGGVLRVRIETKPKT